jgi:hypothetical protein
MIHPYRNRLSQDGNRAVNIAWRSPHLRAGKLHGAIAHALQGHCGAGESKAAGKVHLFRHSLFSSLTKVARALVPAVSTLVSRLFLTKVNYIS